MLFGISGSNIRKLEQHFGHPHHQRDVVEEATKEELGAASKYV